MMDFGDILNNWEEEEKRRAKEAKEGKKPEGIPQNGQAWRNKKTEPGKRPVFKDDIVEITTYDENARREAKKRKQETQINPMELWLRRYGVMDKDAQSEEYEAKGKQQDASYLRELACEARIDLHGLTSDEGWRKLDYFIGECQRRGLQKVLIIHGKGNHSGDNPVLSGMVRNFIERDYRLGAWGHPDKREGGKGATWVIIRNNTCNI